jgi:hypothetical protein
MGALRVRWDVEVGKLGTRAQRTPGRLDYQVNSPLSRNTRGFM